MSSIEISCDDPYCDETTTTWVGEIYFACEKHEEEFVEMINDE